MFASVLVALSCIASTLAINITAPSSNAYWVQFSQNVITWSFNQGDPNPVSIFITNPNSTFLNGPFAIMNNVDLTNGTFTVTNVTLRVEDGYVVNFVNGSNTTQIYASSGSFSVKASGTTPANVTITSASSSSTATSPSGSGNSSASGSASSTSGTPKQTGAASMLRVDGDLKMVYVMGMTAAMALIGAFVTF